ncbi:uncharacterized protein C8Q71DRAFT_861676 [Rhodofomes roseus]|uniref:Uncharacterized protein n=1 Tax=Rhodofomes roseus TaxID=34475 RepID=A0ABQ8K4W8_9APHY|nr:uncharacterized protein C8Q71DRAFT_861676 [Rhodofomes roseus]KAH9831671.1 hypothetical protein C8Q71DRAFT_861676 [Rhodofomes roseus]
MFTWDDTQTTILQASVDKYINANGTARDDVIATALNELEQVQLGELEPLPKEARLQAVEKWLADVSNKRKRQPKKRKRGVMMGTIRGTDVWLDKHRQEVYDNAYSEGTNDPLSKFTDARWATWREVPQEEKAVWEGKAEELRNLVHKEGVKITPRLLPLEPMMNSLGRLCRSVERKSLIEDGAYIVTLYAANTTDKGPVMGVIDHNLDHGATSNFSSLLKTAENYNSIWTLFDGWAKEQLQRKADVLQSRGKPDKPSKAQKKTDFGPLLSVDEETGLPIMLSEAELDSLVAGMVQKWIAIVREFLTHHYLAASNGKVPRIPWKAHASPASCLDASMWLNDMAFQDPSHLKKEQLIRLCKHWREGQDGPDGVKAFKFRSYVNGDGDDACEEYEAYFERWQEEAPVRDGSIVNSQEGNGLPGSLERW